MQADAYRLSQTQVINVENQLLYSLRKDALEVKRWWRSAVPPTGGGLLTALKWVALKETLKKTLMHSAAQCYSLGASLSREESRHAFPLLKEFSSFSSYKERDKIPFIAEEEPLIPDQIYRFYEQSVDIALYRYTNRLKDALSSAVLKASFEGWTPKQLAKEAESLIDGAAGWQAERIARTETFRLWNYGHYAQLNALEDVIGYEYDVVMDARTSNICKPLKGLKVRKESLLYLPPLHPHCRSGIRPIFSFEAEDAIEWGDPQTPQAVITSAGVFGEIPAPLKQIKKAA